MIKTFRLVSVTLLPRAEAKIIRDAFTKQLSADFKNHALRLTVSDAQNYGGDCQCLPHDIHTYQTHHILPVSLGGTNHFNNLVWVDRDLHRWIHEKINWETLGMQTGQSRTIALPVREGIIWGPR